MYRNHGTTFGECNFQEFKQSAAEFFRLADTADREQIANGFKALSIFYFSMEGNDQEEYEASMLLGLAAKRGLDEPQTQRGFEYVR